MLGASLTRYDGWFLAAAMIALVLAVAVFRRSVPRKALVLSLAIAAAGPILWLAYNAAVYKNPLEFANGPYSARAIEQRTSAPGSPPHPGAADLPVAASFFLKSAELNVGESNWHRIWPLLALVGCVLLLFVQRKRWPLLLLWLPLPFYTLSVAYSGVPIFLPPWWPFSLYNVRYGIELLPAFAVFCGFLVAVGPRSPPRDESKTSSSGAWAGFGLHQLCIRLESPTNFISRSLGQLAHPCST